MPKKSEDGQDEEPTLDHLGNMMGSLLKVPKDEVKKPESEDDEQAED